MSGLPSLPFKTYVVGGAVRDMLLGLPVKDRDHVVVGATPGQMQAQGFVPVGKDFPVFLHPDTHEEYALARTERKIAPGYTGFAFHAAPEVSLEQDLQRRDLTINAMAIDSDGSLIDPCGGQADLQKKIFRHVAPAFAEDPVRILRLARFAARFTEFSVAAETLALMQQMVQVGEVDALVPERVWQELARGMMESQPSRMFAVLRDCGALARILPELDALACGGDGYEQLMRTVDGAAHQQHELAIRFAVLLQDVPPGEAAAAAMCARLKVPKAVRDLALMAAREQRLIASAAALDAANIVSLLERCDAFRKPARFLDCLTVVQCKYGVLAKPWPPAQLLAQALSAAQAVPAGQLAAAVSANYTDQLSTRIPQAILAARIKAVAQALEETKTRKKTDPTGRSDPLTRPK